MVVLLGKLGTSKGPPVGEALQFDSILVSGLQRSPQHRTAVAHSHGAHHHHHSAFPSDHRHQLYSLRAQSIEDARQTLTCLPDFCPGITVRNWATGGWQITGTPPVEMAPAESSGFYQLIVRSSGLIAEPYDKTNIWATDGCLPSPSYASLCPDTRATSTASGAYVGGRSWQLVWAINEVANAETVAVAVIMGSIVVSDCAIQLALS